MQLKEIGEFGFIERFKPHFNDLLNGDIIGIGDDCAIIPANENEDWVVTTDLLMEDVHFLRQSITPFQLGYKSLAVNLSDIAAMGGAPMASFLSIAIPKDLEVEYLDQFMEGYHELSKKYNTALLGGDTTKSLKHLAINVVVIGKCSKGKARKRSDAKVGDVICVTGNLGDSAGGLQLLLDGITRINSHDELLTKHHQPEPQIKEGIFLAKENGVNAMMDISDGIASDLKHILKASGVSAKIEIQYIPISDQLNDVAQQNNWNALDMATSGGEDYELLLTISASEFDIVKRKFESQFNKSLIKIGTIESGDPVINWVNKGNEIQLTSSGFNHFK